MNYIEGAIYIIGFFFIIEMIGKKMGFSVVDKLALKELPGFTKSKATQKDKIEKIKDDDPEEQFNIIEIDYNRGKGRFLSGVNTDEHGYVMNTDIPPIYFENAIPIDIPVRVYHKNLARQLNIYDPDFKLNPACADLKRLIGMKILKAFMTIARNPQDNLHYITIFLLLMNIGFMYFGVYENVKPPG